MLLANPETESEKSANCGGAEIAFEWKITSRCHKRFRNRWPWYSHWLISVQPWVAFRRTLFCGPGKMIFLTWEEVELLHIHIYSYQKRKYQKYKKCQIYVTFNYWLIISQLSIRLNIVRIPYHTASLWGYWFDIYLLLPPIRQVKCICIQALSGWLFHYLFRRRSASRTRVWKQGTPWCFYHLLFNWIIHREKWAPLSLAVALINSSSLW